MDIKTLGHLSYTGESSTDIAYNFKRIVGHTGAFIKVNCWVQNTIREPQVHMHYFGPWKMDSHLDILVNDKLFAEQVQVKGEDKGRTTNKIEGANIFTQGANEITIRTHGSGGVLFFGHIEVLTQVDTMLGTMSQDQHDKIAAIKDGKVEMGNRKFTILAEAADDFSSVIWHYSLDKVKEMALTATQVLICDETKE